MQAKFDSMKKQLESQEMEVMEARLIKTSELNGELDDDDDDAGTSTQKYCILKHIQDKQNIFIFALFCADILHQLLIKTSRGCEFLQTSTTSLKLFRAKL